MVVAPSQGALHFASWDEWAEEHPEKETLVCPNCREVTEVSEGTVRFSKKGKEKTGRSGEAKE